jgi:hypothetical protein
MIDVIEPTLAEVYTCVVLGVASLIFLAFIWIKGKIEENTSILDRDQEDYK